MRLLLRPLQGIATSAGENAEDNGNGFFRAAGESGKAKRRWETRQTMSDFEALAREIGFEQAGAISADAVVTSADLAASCNPGACRKYASCWTCPPGAGTYEELQVDITSKRAGLVVQTVRDGIDYFEDWEVLDETRALHNDRLDQLAGAMRDELEGVLEFSTGGCDLCDECTYPDAPCAQPDKRRESLSAHGVAVGTLCERAGLDYSFKNGSVRFVGMILHN